MSKATMGMEPIRRAVTVSWDQRSAFKRFTEQFAQWWPYREMSIGGRRIVRVAFECEVGGRIFEEQADGTRFKWGNVTEWDPPRKVAFTWHAAREEVDAQQVEVTFTAVDVGTRVELVSSGWEKLSGAARDAHSGYEMSWSVIMNYFAGKRTVLYWLFWLFSFLMDRTRGRQQFVDNAGGRMSS